MYLDDMLMMAQSREELEGQVISLLILLGFAREVTAATNLVNSMLNKNTLGVKKVRGQSEAALQIGICDQKL